MPAVQDFNLLLRALRTDTPPSNPIARKWLDAIASGLVPDEEILAAMTDEDKATMVLADVREYLWGIYNAANVGPVALTAVQTEEARIRPDRGDIGLPGRGSGAATPGGR